MTNGVASATAQTYSGSQTVSAKNKTVSKDDFLKLLTYQLKAQNPLQPYDNQEFAAQLAQFSQLEQLTDIRSLLEEQNQSNQLLAQTISNSALPGLLGKSAKALFDKFSYDGDHEVPIGYFLPEKAASGEMIIKDSAGNTVKTIELSAGQLSNGDHKLQWDGKDSKGNKLAAGNYSVQVVARDNSGTAINSNTYTYGTIQAVRFKSDGTKLVMNGIEVPLEDITDITTEN